MMKMVIFGGEKRRGRKKQTLTGRSEFFMHTTTISARCVPPGLLFFFFLLFAMHEIFLFFRFPLLEECSAATGKYPNNSRREKSRKSNPIGLDQRTWCNTDINSVPPPPSSRLFAQLLRAPAPWAYIQP